MRAVHLLRFEHKITTLCRVLKVCRSSYYAHFKEKPLGKRKVERKKLREKILVIYAKSKKRIGPTKMVTQLKAEYGINASNGRVEKLMKDMNLPKMSTHKWIPKKSDLTKNEEGKYLMENKIKQNFSPSIPNKVWASDITYINTKDNGFVFLCVIIDLFSRKVISYEVSNKINTELTKKTFLNAYTKRNEPSSFIFHSDRGCQYTSLEFRKMTDELDICQSFSKPGYPYDNAVVESFFKYAKKEEFNRKSFKDIHEVKSSAFEYIEGFYNQNRPHSFNDNLTPNEKERRFYDIIV